MLAALALLVPAAAAQAVPDVSVNDVTVTEGNVNATFTVSIDEPAPPGGVSVNYATADATARQPGDYTATSGILTIPEGQTSNTVLVPVREDSLDEVNETFELNLSSASGGGATIADSRGVGTINDDDPAPSLSVTDANLTEADTTDRTLTFTVRLSAVSGRDVTVGFATADGGARQPGDYAPAGGTLTIPAGATTRTIPVVVRGDLLDEANETLSLNLFNASGASISDSRGVGTITDDDPVPTVSIRDARSREGAPLGFVITLSRVSGRSVNVSFSSASRTALAGRDYAGVNGRVTIPAGATRVVVFLGTVGDRLDEPNETLRMSLSRPTNGRIGDASATGTIVDDDSPANARPRVTRLHLRPFATRRPRRPQIRFTLSERARVVFQVERRVGRRWVRRRWGFSRAGRAGANRMVLPRIVGGRRLGTGRYRLVVVARDRLGLRSFVRRAQFRIL